MFRSRNRSKNACRLLAEELAGGLFDAVTAAIVEAEADHLAAEDRLELPKAIVRQGSDVVGEVVAKRLVVSFLGLAKVVCFVTSSSSEVVSLSSSWAIQSSFDWF